MINAVFVQSEAVSGITAERTITIVMRYYRDRHECDMTVVASGGGSLFESQEAAESTVMERVKDLARGHDWETYRSYPGHAGSECPYCAAFYMYNQSQILDDGSVRCQNCDKSYMLTESQRSEASRAVLKKLK